MKQKSDSTKNKIIKSAFSFYDRLVFDRVSLSKIASKSGISKAAIYRHFRSREDLENSMTEYVVESFVNEVQFQGDEEKFIADSISFLCRNSKFLYYFISVKANFNLDPFIRIIREREYFGLKKDFVPDVHNADKGQYERMVFIAGTIFIFQFSRKKLVGKKGFKDSDSNIEEYSKKMVSFLKSGLHQDTSSISKERFSYLDDLCKKAIASSIDDSDETFKAIATVISRDGLQNTTVQSISDALGIAKSSLYTSFYAKGDFIKSYVEKEMISFFDIIRKTVIHSENPAESVYILMAIELEYFLKKKEVLVALKWFQYKNHGTPTRSKKVKKENDILDFYGFLCNLDVFSSLPDLGTPSIEPNTFFEWIFSQPIFFITHAILHGFSEKELREMLKDIFYFVENGVTLNEK